MGLGCSLPAVGRTGRRPDRPCHGRNRLGRADPVPGSGPGGCDPRRVPRHPGCGAGPHDPDNRRRPRRRSMAGDRRCVHHRARTDARAGSQSTRRVRRASSAALGNRRAPGRGGADASATAASRGRSRGRHCGPHRGARARPTGRRPSASRRPSCRADGTGRDASDGRRRPSPGEWVAGREPGGGPGSAAARRPGRRTPAHEQPGVGPGGAGPG